MTLKNLAVEFGESHTLAAKQAQAMLGSVMGLLVAHLKAGETVQIAASRKVAF